MSLFYPRKIQTLLVVLYLLAPQSWVSAQGSKDTSDLKSRGIPDPYNYFADKKDADLAYAALKGRTGKVANFIKDGANPNAESKDGLPMVAWMILADSKDGFQALLDGGAKPDASIHRRNFPDNLPEFEIRAHSNDVFWMAQLVQHGLSPDFRPDPLVDENLLNRAVSSGRVELIGLLVKAGADVNHRDFRGTPPLIRSITAGLRLPIALALLDVGADWRVTDRKGDNFVDHLKRRLAEDAKKIEKLSEYGPLIEHLKKLGAPM